MHQILAGGNVGDGGCHASFLHGVGRQVTHRFLTPFQHLGSSKLPNCRKPMEMSSFPLPRLYLILLQTALLHHFVSLLLERNDDESHENVDEEEREDHKIDNIKNGHLHAVAAAGPTVLLRHIHRMLQHPVGRQVKKSNQRYAHQDCHHAALLTGPTLYSQLCLSTGITMIR